MVNGLHLEQVESRSDTFSSSGSSWKQNQSARTLSLEGSCTCAQAKDCRRIERRADEPLPASISNHSVRERAHHMCSPSGIHPIDLLRFAPFQQRDQHALSVNNSRPWRYILSLCPGQAAVLDVALSKLLCASTLSIKLPLLRRRRIPVRIVIPAIVNAPRHAALAKVTTTILALI